MTGRDSSTGKPSRAPKPARNDEEEDNPTSEPANNQEDGTSSVSAAKPRETGRKKAHASASIASGSHATGADTPISQQGPHTTQTTRPRANYHELSNASAVRSNIPSYNDAHKWLRAAGKLKSDEAARNPRELFKLGRAIFDKDFPVNEHAGQGLRSILFALEEYLDGSPNPSRESPEEPTQRPATTTAAIAAKTPTAKQDAETQTIEETPGEAREEHTNDRNEERIEAILSRYEAKVREMEDSARTKEENTRAREAKLMKKAMEREKEWDRMMEAHNTRWTHWLEECERVRAGWEDHNKRQAAEREIIEGLSEELTTNIRNLGSEVDEMRERTQRASDFTTQVDTLLANIGTRDNERSNRADLIITNLTTLSEALGDIQADSARKLDQISKLQEDAHRQDLHTVKRNLNKSALARTAVARAAKRLSSFLDEHPSTNNEDSNGDFDNSNNHTPTNDDQTGEQAGSNESEREGREGNEGGSEDNDDVISNEAADTGMADWQEDHASAIDAKLVDTILAQAVERLEEGIDKEIQKLGAEVTELTGQLRNSTETFEEASTKLQQACRFTGTFLKELADHSASIKTAQEEAISAINSTNSQQMQEPHQQNAEGPANSAPAAIGKTRLSYAQATATQHALSAPPAIANGTLQMALTREDWKRRQVRIELSEQATEKWGKREGKDAVDFANKILDVELLQLSDRPIGTRIVAAQNLHPNGLVLTLNTSKAAAWLRREDVARIFSENFAEGTVIKLRTYDVVVEFVPFTMNIAHEDDLREALAEANIRLDELEATKWIKNPENRKQGQTVGHARFSFRTAAAANAAIKHGLITHGKHVFARQPDPEPLQCTKCLKYGHPASRCKQQSLTCAYCGKTHASKECKMRHYKEKWHCTNCDKQGHHARDRECPTLQQRRRELVKKQPEFQYQFYITDEPYTWQLLPEYQEEVDRANTRPQGDRYSNTTAPHQPRPSQ